MIDTPRDEPYWDCEPEKNIWKCDKKMPMKNSSDIISFREVPSEEKVVDFEHRHSVLFFYYCFKAISSSFAICIIFCSDSDGMSESTAARSISEFRKYDFAFS